MRWVTFYARTVNKIDFHAATLLLDCRLWYCIAAPWPQTWGAPGWHLARSECPKCWTIKSLTQKFSCLVYNPTLPQTQNTKSVPSWPSTLERMRRVLSDASPDAARCCHVPCQSLTCSCWAVTAPSLTCSWHGAATSHPSFQAVSPISAKAALSNAVKPWASKCNTGTTATEKTDWQFLKAFHLRAGNDY